MSGIEQKIKDFAKEQGVAVVGVAGPERLDGPPSLDPTYTMKGAKSIVSLVVPMDTDAIYKFLGKEAYQPHLTDQTRWNTKLNRISARIPAKPLMPMGLDENITPGFKFMREEIDKIK